MRRLLLMGILVLMLLPTQAQDGLNLPTELYILLNAGAVERYGLGTAGVRQITPQDSFVLDFGVAPDGNWFAYRTTDGLYISNMFSDEEQQIEDTRASIPNIRGQGNTIVWSPNSDALAYTTEYGGRVAFLEADLFADLLTPGLLNLRWSPDGQYLAAEALEGVWWIFRRQSTEMILTAAIPGAQGADWLSPTEIIYAPVEGGVTIIDLTNNNQPTIVLDNSAIYHLPYVLDNGQIRVFVGDATAARLIEVINAGTGNIVGEISVGEVDLTGVHWSPQGQLLTAFQGGALALIDPASGAGFTLPIAGAATYGWGPDYPASAVGINLTHDGYFLALDTSGVIQVWRLPSDGTLPVTISPSALDITEFDISPDASRIAYVSNSSLWAFALGTDNEPIEVVQLGISDNIAPSWGPDNETLYYRDEQEDATGIYRVIVGQEPEIFVPDTEDSRFSNPQLAGGVGAMVVNRNSELMVVDTTSGEQTLLYAIGTGQWMSGTELLINANVLQGALTGHGLFAYDANDLTTDPQLIMPILGKLRVLDYQAQGDVIRILVQNSTPSQVQILDIARDGSAPTVIGNAGYMIDPLISPDGNTIVGYTSPGGALIIYDVPSDQRTVIDTLPQVSHFVWE
ncbi:MAG: WD40 repeat domain-containing protein [Anaerolineae bacterium]|nr:WD40 repeat domain-containing protein [Anaerolineae bacterium]MDQ7036396.1 WD40 repeat domain-containing protein [Anaerolineae bacterium]